jgi:hypothetical protein
MLGRQDKNSESKSQCVLEWGYVLADVIELMLVSETCRTRRDSPTCWILPETLQARITVPLGKGNLKAYAAL